MHSILRGSIIYRFFAALFSRIGAQWRESRIISHFLSPKWSESVARSSIFTRLWEWAHKQLCNIFEKTKLNNLLRGSIFTMPFIWSFIAVALAPILPTMVVLGLSLLCIVSLILAFGCSRERAPAQSPLNKYVLLFALVYIVATVTSVTVSGSLRGGALTTLFVLFTIVIQNAVTTKRQFDALIYAFVASGAAVSAYGVYQYVFGAVNATAWLDATMFSDIGIRVYSTLDNPNVLAEYLLLVIPFAGACIIAAKGLIKKVFFTGCLGLMLLCMVLTYARGGWLGLIIAAAVFLVILDRRFILLGVAGLILLYFTLPATILNRFLSIGNIGDSSTAYRVSIWLATLAMLKDYWFTGIGPGSAAFNRIYPLYSYNTVHAPHAHNLYLQIVCDAGIISLVIFCVILFDYFRSLCAAVSREQDKTSKIFQIAAISSVLGFLVQSATDYSFYNYRVTLVFWAVLGLGALAARRGALAGNADGGIACSTEGGAEGRAEGGIACSTKGGVE